MKITFYLKNPNLGALDFNTLNKLWALLKPKGDRTSPLTQYPELMQLEDLSLLLRHGYLKVKREEEHQEYFLVFELNVQGLDVKIGN